MLVLSRNKEDKIQIGDDIVITVLEIGRDRVRLGITAPRNIPVYREEIYTAMQSSPAKETP